MKMIVPAILEEGEKEIIEKTNRAKGVFEKVHVDYIDESYGNVSSLPVNWDNFNVFKKVGIHLMTNKIGDLLGKIPPTGEKTVYVQVEKMQEMDPFLKTCEEKHVLSGLAIDLETKIEDIDRVYFEKIKAFLLLAVKAGKSGQKFDERVLCKIKALREKVGNTAEIIIDGGINVKTGKQCFECGADGLAVNSFLWNNFGENSKKLLNLAKNYEI